MRSKTKWLTFNLFLCYAENVKGHQQELMRGYIDFFKKMAVGLLCILIHQSLSFTIVCLGENPVMWHTAVENILW